MEQTEIKIPCTVAVLTLNSEKTLRSCLDSVKDFAEILICDGGSTDGTLEIARTYGARVISQSDEFLDQNRRLIDFSGVRNQLLFAAEFDWQFHLDSDESLSKDMVKEIREVVVGNLYQNTFIFLVPRKYESFGEVIERSINYPSYQYRFFNRTHVHPFTKKVHERIRFDKDQKVGRLRCCMQVPMNGTAESLWERNLRYIEMESRSLKNSFGLNKFKLTFKLVLRIVILMIRLFTRRFLRRGKKLPIAFDIIPIKYQFTLLQKIL